MNDITSGDNILLSSGLNGYRAHQGWDAATGWGSPRDAGIFLRALLNVNTLPTPITGTPTAPINSLPTTGTPITAASKSR